jgi:catechol 2,3-dioxygenase-like lactoylglutathione lyase family enzyme
VFFRSKDPKRLVRWYARHFGLRPEPFGGVVFFGDDNPRGRTAGSTVWAPFPRSTEYFGRRSQAGMINYRVDDLDAVLARLRRARVRIDPDREEADTGRFAWAYDIEGNRFELWEPRELTKPPRRRTTR